MGAGQVLGDDGIGTYKIDKMVGGIGDDTYHIDNDKDQITEPANSGTHDKIIVDSDYIGKNMTFAIPTNVEDLDLSAFNVETMMHGLVDGKKYTEKNYTDDLAYLRTHKISINGNASNNIIQLNDVSGNYMNVFAGAGNDTVIGGKGNDYIDGGAGDDTLYGGAGTNSLLGGAGNDSYVFDGMGTNIISDSAGNDTILLRENGGNYLNNEFSLAGYSSIENLDASDILTGGMTLSGNALDNTITGGAGSDTLKGGAGNDTYIIKDLNDSIIDTLGSNTIQLDSRFTGNIYLSDTYLSATISKIDGTDATANLDLVGSNSNATTIIGGIGNDSIIAGTGKTNDIMYGGDGNDILSGRDGNDTLYGGAGDDGLYGGAGDDTLYGGAGNDYLSGFSGSNVLNGGIGDDTYQFGGRETKTTIIDESGIDTIVLAGTQKDTNNPESPTTYFGSKTAGEIASASVSLASYAMIENLDASRITDTKTNLTLTGNVSKNTITGGAGDDTLFGGADILADKLIGEAGNDTYILKDTKDLIVDTDGANIIKLDKTFGEKSLNLKNTIGYDYTQSNITTIDAMAVTNALTLTGNATATTIYGGAGNDTIYGGLGDDVIYGGAGNNTIYGGAGINQLYGGAGDDTFIVDGSENFASKDYVIDGGKGINTIKTVSANNDGYFYFGGVKQDSYEYASIETADTIQNLDCSAITKTALTMTGNDLTNTITGGALNDTISGGKGADTLVGGTGDDTYYVDNASDKITELTGGGNDTVKLTSAISYTLANNVENLDLSEFVLGSYSKALGLTVSGNSSDNIITASTTGEAYMKILAGAGNDTIYGKLGNDYIDGGAGNDVIYGGGGTNTLIGGDGNDTIYCDGGSNYLVGGAGNDTYYTNGYDDIKGISDTAGIDTFVLTNEANDKLKTNDPLDVVQLSICPVIENFDASALNAIGITIIGNALNNTITGGSLNDILQGGAGNDSLIGGNGNDTLNGGIGSDTLDGGSGNNTYSFAKGDGKDSIVATSSADLIMIDGKNGVSKEDLLYYTDKTSNFYIDYTDKGVGTDIIKINSGQYNADTTIQVGNYAIHINSILSQLAATNTAGLDSAHISALKTSNEAAQFLTLAAQYADMTP